MNNRQKARIISLFVILSLLLGTAGGSDHIVKAAATAEPIAYIGSLGAAVSKTSGTSLVVNTTAPVTTGDDIIITYATDPNSSLVISVADPAGNSYYQVGNVVNSGQLRTYVFAAYNVNSMPSGSSITINASPAVTARAAVVALFRGLADSSPLDQTITGTGSSAAPSSGASAATTQADELLIGAIGTEGPDGDTIGTWDSSFTAGPRLGTTGGTADTNITADLGYRIVSITGAYTASKSGITSCDWAAMIATFKAGADGAHPAIYTTGTPLSAFSSLPGSPSAVQTYTVSASSLTEAITITAPADFQISLSSGGGFASSLVLPQSGGSVAATPVFVRFNRATEGSSTGYLAHASSGATTRNIAVSGTSAPLSPVAFNIMLGRPTNVSVTTNIIPDQDVEFYIEYGNAPDTYTSQTVTYNVTANQPVEFVIGGLSANTRYYYQIVYRRAGTTDWNEGTEHSFITQRAPGSTFTFTVTSDSHLGQYGGQTADEKDLYEQTLLNAAADHPDFHIDTGDTFAMDPSPLGTGMTDAEADAAYLIQRPPLGLITDSIPYFLAIGNHENEEGWNFDDVFTAPDQSLARVGLKYRKKYIPNPVPDAFYTGNTDPLDTAIGGDTNQEDYYAWTWGDALFVVIDPYHYSMKWPSEGDTYGGEGQDGEVSGTRWDWSLGIQQYLWLKSTLENSTATYKFVFTHQVTGGSTVYGRGGVGAAPYFEWGGKNADGTWGFDTHRPASAGWTVPVHQLMVANGVDIFFHGHDHIYSYEQLDGITYVECAKPDDAGYAWEPYGYGYNENLYPNGVSIQNSGHLRVSVSPAETKVEYVRSYLPGDGTNGIVAHSFTVSGSAPTTYALTVSKTGSGSGTVTSVPSGINCGSTCTASFTADSTVTLTAAASTGSTFSGWSGAGCSGTGTCNVTMSAAQSVTATFALNTYALTVTKAGAGTGTVTSAPTGITCGATCSASFNYNLSVVLTAVAATGSTFSGWTGNTACTGTGTCTIIMTAAQTVTATFSSNNVAPVAVADTYTAQKNTAMTITVPGVLSNDTDANLDTLTASKVADPLNGGLTLNANGSFTYTPTTGYIGDDSFTYQAYDGFLYSSTVTVTFHVIDGTPPGFPSSFYGEIHLTPSPSAGNFLEAYVPGAAGYVARTAITDSTPLTYAFDVPGDITGTTAKEGGVEGDVITFKINTNVVGKGIWHGGTSARLDFTTATHTISLVSGWNLVSFKVLPYHTAVAEVLSSLGTSYDLVYAWNAAGGSWLKYDRTAGYGNTLTDLDESMGFWIRMTGTGTLTVTGGTPGTSTIALKTGWNLVGFPANANLALPAALSAHGVTDFSLVYGYHAGDTADPWKKYDTAASYGNDLEELAPGWGYWIKVGGTPTWSVGY